MCWRIVLLCLLVITTLTQNAWGQVSADSTHASASYQFALKEYWSSIARQAALYNGSEYPEPSLSSNGSHPYFDQDEFENGLICYRGEYYDKVPLLYDVLKDELIIQHFDQSGYGVKVKVRQEYISSFSFLNHSFVRIGEHSGEATTGFLELLYDGKIKLYSKRSKYHREEVSIAGVQHHYTANDHYYILRLGVLYQTDRKGSVLSALEDKKKDISRFIRSAKLKFSETKEKDFISIARFYDQSN